MLATVVLMLRALCLLCAMCLLPVMLLLPAMCLMSAMCLLLLLTGLPVGLAWSLRVEPRVLSCVLFPRPAQRSPLLELPPPVLQLCLLLAPLLIPLSLLSHLLLI